MGNSEFDKYIRSHTKKELDSPLDLNWDNMDIPLPKEEQKDRKIYFYLIGFLIFIGGNLVFFNKYENKSTNDEYESSLVLKNISDSKVDIAINQNVESENLYHLKNEPNEREPIIKVNTAKSEVSATRKNNKSNNSNIENKKAKQILISIDINQSQLSTNFSNNENEPLLLSSKAEVLNNINSKLKKKDFLELSNIVGLAISLIPNQRKTTNLDLSNKDETTKYLFNKAKKKRLDFQLEFGLNTFQSNYNSSNQADRQKNAEQIAVGNSLKFILRKNFKNQTFVNLGVKYQKLHNTFSDREFLGLFIKPNSLITVERTKYIYHNNYFESWSLNFGVGKSFKIIKNLGIDVSVNINPSFRLKKEGRIFNDELEIIYLENNEPSKSMFWTASSDLDLFYKFKNNKIFAGAGFSQAVSNIKLIEDSNLSQQPQIFTFKIGIGRSF